MDSGVISRPLIEINNLSKSFPIKQPILDIILRKPQKFLKAVDDVSLVINKGETMGLVGESGCGKSTLARTIVRLYDPQKGEVVFDGIDITNIKGKQLRELRRNFQIIFQDPYSSLNPRFSVRDMLSEILSVHKMCPKSELDDRIIELMNMVGLSKQYLNRFPGEFSGGQRQRIGIAKALALKPQFIIADEPVSALDVSIQAQIINLLARLQKQLNLTILFISHDLRVVRHITHSVAIMYLGKIVELGKTSQVFEAPHHPYSNVLIKSAPVLDPRHKAKDYLIEGEPPSPINIPTGCRFHPRCPYMQERCKAEIPELMRLPDDRLVACHYPV